MKRYPYQPESMEKLNRLYELSDYPAIEAVIRHKTGTLAKRLDGRTISAVLAFITPKEINTLSQEELDLMRDLHK